MKRVFAALTVALSVLCVTAPAEAKQPPSFAFWSAREGNYGDALLAHAKNGSDVLAVLAKAKPHWGHGITTIAKDQKPACRKAIHTYWLAAIKYYRAESIYLTGHKRDAVASIGAALTTSEPYETLVAAKDAAKSRAVRVCG